MTYIPRGKEKLLFFPARHNEENRLQVVFQETVAGVVYNAITATLEFRKESGAIVVTDICYEYGDIPQKDRLLQLLRGTYTGIPCAIYTTVNEE